MENASKALIMAAGVLIGVMVISLGVYLFLTFSMSASKVHEENAQTQLDQFNSQFLKYNGLEVNIYDVVTMASLAYENNKDYGLTKKEDYNYYIEVKFNNKNIENNNNEANTKLIEDNNKGTKDKDYELPTFDCTVHVNEYTGRVDSVTFKS